MPPGLTTSIHGPKFEKASRVPSALAEPTVSTRVRLPGTAASPLPSLPAETTVIVPLANAAVIACSRTAASLGSTSAAGLLLERLMTPAPRATASSMPRTTQATVVSDERL